jgi:hypothetical protein
MAVQRRRDRVMTLLHTLSEPAQRAILDSLSPAERARYAQQAGQPCQASQQAAAEATQPQPPVGGRAET